MKFTPETEDFTKKSINMIYHLDRIKAKTHVCHNYLDRGRQNIWQNVRSFHDKKKNSQGRVFH